MYLPNLAKRCNCQLRQPFFRLVVISPRSKYYGKLAEREGLDPPWPFGLLFSRQAHLPILPSLHKLDHQTGFAPSLWGFADLRICYSAIDGFKINIRLHHNLLATPVGIEPAFSHRKWLVLTIIRWGHFILAFLFWKINQKMPRRRPVCHLYKGDVGQYVHWHCHHQKPSTWQKGIWLTRVVFCKTWFLPLESQ